MNKCVKNIYYSFNNLRQRLKNKTVKICSGVNLAPGVKLCGKNTINSGTYFKGELGYASYLGSNCQVSAKVGKYCSIASNVKVIIGKHPTKDFVSTHPMFFSKLKQNGYTYVSEQKFEENNFCKNSDFHVIIGNDVWVGHGSIIMAGVEIGDGAVIAAGAVVTKDVEPYAIVGGVPAKVIKYRFEKEQIQQLLDVKWWDKPEEWIMKNAQMFSDIEVFLQQIKE